MPCPGGWLILPARLGGNTLLADEPVVVATLIEVLDFKPQFVAAAIQVPIGFPDEPGTFARCDLEAKELLGWPRGAALPATPSREALAAPTLEQARALEPWLTTGDLRRFPALREAADTFEPYHQRRWYSAHHDLSYRVMNGDVALTSSPYLPEGIEERFALIPRTMPGVEQVISAPPPEGAAREHVVQVAGLLWTARRALGRAITRLPIDPEWDARGLRHELVY